MTNSRLSLIRISSLGRRNPNSALPIEDIFTWIKNIIVRANNIMGDSTGSAMAFMQGLRKIKLPGQCNYAILDLEQPYSNRDCQTAVVFFLRSPNRLTHVG